MRTAIIQDGFNGWRGTAQTLLHDGIPPQEVVWEEADASQQGLGFGEPLSGAVTNRDAVSPGQFRVPKRFIETAKVVVSHSDPGKWALLYRVLWRLTHGEPRLLESPLDPDAIALNHLEKEVQKDAYRMRAFVRFRESRLNDEPWFVAWYEPEHDTLAMNEQFFTDRFANMRWSILTPKRCMHWDGAAVVLSEGVDASKAPSSDNIEPLWITYYSNIFNPARIKPAAMQAQLLKRNWKNLPEAVVIEPLLRDAPRRASAMIARSEFLRERDSDYVPVQLPPNRTLADLRTAAASCRSCPLWKTATCTVFGEGISDARVVLVGEQPGDQEDLAGKPFIGPAGQTLNRALAAAGIDRAQLYVTNAVKHFKFEPPGKRRIHKTVGAREIAACRPWLEAELSLLKPALVVALGATAARSIFNEPIRITEMRGQVLESQFGPTLVTIHPSALLRLPEGADFSAEFARFVADLSLVPNWRSPFQAGG